MIRFSQLYWQSLFVGLRVNEHIDVSITYRRSLRIGRSFRPEKFNLLIVFLNMFMVCIIG